MEMGSASSCRSPPLPSYVLCEQGKDPTIYASAVTASLAIKYLGKNKNKKKQVGISEEM